MFRGATQTGAAGTATTTLQQTRGMKVHSSVKKRCEHCKVRPGVFLEADGQY